MWKGQELEIRCPFTGRKLLACDMDGAWVGVSQGPEGGWVTTLFPTKPSLVMFLAASIPVPFVDEPRTAPDRKCPIFGTPVVVKCLGDLKNWVAQSVNADGRGYVTTQFYSERHLDYFLSTRAGVPPVFGNGDVEIRERAPPPPADLMLEESTSRLEAVNDHVQEVIDKVGLEAGVLIPKVIVGAGRDGRKRGRG